MFSRFFIDRPIFAAVLSIFLVLAGLAAMRTLPIAQYPEIAPPVVTVRVVYPGADESLPLRMVAAGVGAKVGITLYVIGEGRYRPQNFPEARLDDDLLTWDRQQNRSNYEELSQAAMGTNGGHSWITE